MKQRNLILFLALFLSVLFVFLKVLSPSAHWFIDVPLYFFTVVFLLGFSDALLGIRIRWLVHGLHKTNLFIRHK